MGHRTNSPGYCVTQDTSLAHVALILGKFGHPCGILLKHDRGAFYPQSQCIMVEIQDAVFLKLALRILHYTQHPVKLLCLKFL